MALISTIIGKVPKELNKWRHYYRGAEEYSSMFPKLSHTDLEKLTEKVNSTKPGSIQRKQIIDYYHKLNQKEL